MNYCEFVVCAFQPNLRVFGLQTRCTRAMEKKKNGDKRVFKRPHVDDMFWTRKAYTKRMKLHKKNTPFVFVVLEHVLQSRIRVSRPSDLRTEEMLCGNPPDGYWYYRPTYGPITRGTDPSATTTPVCPPPPPPMGGRRLLGATMTRVAHTHTHTCCCEVCAIGQKRVSHKTKS